VTKLRLPTSLSHEQKERHRRLLADAEKDTKATLATHGNIVLLGRDVRQLRVRPVGRRGQRGSASDYYLNDEIVNAFTDLMSSAQQKPTFYVFSTHFYTWFEDNDFSYEDVTRWTKAVNIFDYDLLFIPVHSTSPEHWALLVVDVQARTLHYLDSLAGGAARRQSVVTAVAQYLACELRKLHRMISVKGRLPTEGTAFHLNSDPLVSPLQGNSWDCGVFMCASILQLSRGRSLSLAQNDMGMFRRLLLLSVVGGELQFG
jgi:sentrin-specific protease 1